jgi:hypothetical protein
MAAIDLSSDPRAVRVRKRPVTRAVVFAPEDGVCRTLEGDVAYHAGDAIVTGERGEQWPVAREQFRASYRAVDPAREGEDGFYVNRPAILLARQLDAAGTVQAGTQDDILQGAAGDWIVEYQDGSHSIVRADIFGDSYEQIERGAME